MASYAICVIYDLYKLPSMWLYVLSIPTYILHATFYAAIGSIYTYRHTTCYLLCGYTFYLYIQTYYMLPSMWLYVLSIPTYILHATFYAAIGSIYTYRHTTCYLLCGYTFYLYIQTYYMLPSMWLYVLSIHTDILHATFYMLSSIRQSEGRRNTFLDFFYKVKGHLQVEDDERRASPET